MKKFGLIIFTIFFVSFAVFSQKVGLVLSGGGAKGIAHIGVIKALEDNNIPIDYIAGTSMGAIVGAMYAMGYSPDEMIKILKSDEFKRWTTGDIDPKYVYYYRNADPRPSFAEVRFNINQLDSLKFRTTFIPTNIVNPREMNFAFLKLFSRANALAKGDFDHLFVPFRCVASDIYDKKAVVFGKGNLGDAVRASMTYPFMFKPIKINNKLLFDGGIFNNFPVNVMKEDFHPDIIIGSKVAANPHKPKEDDLLGQLENMILNKTNYNIPPKEGIMLNFHLEDIGPFDFSKVDELVNIGYNEVIKQLPEIEARIKSRIPLSVIKERRKKFNEELPELRFKKVEVLGVDSLQKIYIERSFHSGNKTFDLHDFKVAYFKLISDDKISEVLPKAIYNDSTKLFDLQLQVKTENQLKFTVGGNISSTTSNQAYFGLTFQNLKDYAQTAYVDGQFGRVYNGLRLGSRIDVPTVNDWYIKLLLVIHRFDYYENPGTFYDESYTPYFNQSELYSKFNVGFPLTMKGRVEFGIGYGALFDQYQKITSQTSDQLDRSNYSLVSAFTKLETHTLNNVMYPTKGYDHSASFEVVTGNERYISALDPEVDNSRSSDLWMQFNAKYDSYFSLSKHFTLGAYAEAVISTRKFNNNYISTIIQAPAFKPTPYTKAVFNPNFSANQFAVLGLKPIYIINSRMNFRTEMYCFAPYKAIYEKPDYTAAYMAPFKKLDYMIESTFVIDLKFASVGFYLNHFSSGVRKWNYGLNLGFLLFDKKFLEN